MSYCPNCQVQLEPGVTVCPQCNQPVPAEGGGPQAPPSPYGQPPQPPYGQPPSSPYGPAPPMYQGPKTNGFAIAALVLGILGFCSGSITGILGVIFGIVALNQIKNSVEPMGGRGMAIAGIITGGISLAIYIIYFIFMLIIGLAEGGSSGSIF